MYVFKLKKPVHSLLYFLLCFSFANIEGSEKVGCKITYIQSENFPFAFKNTLKKQIIDNRSLGLIRHRQSFEEKVNLTFEFPVRTFQHYGLKVVMEFSERDKKQCILIPRKSLSELSLEVCNDLIHKILVETNRKEGIKLSLNTAENIMFIDDSKGDLNLQLFEKNNNPHYFSKISKDKTPTILPRNKERSDASNINHNFKSQSLFRRFLELSQRPSNNLSSFPKSKQSGLSALYPQLSLNEYWTDRNKPTRLEISTHTISEKNLRHFGDFNFKSDGTLFTTNFLFAKKIAKYTFGISTSLGKSTSSYAFNSLTSATSFNFDNFDLSIRDTHVYGSAKLPHQNIPIETFINLKLPTGTKSEFMTSDSTDITLGLLSTFLALDYQLSYTLVGSSNFYNLLQNNTMSNYFALALGKKAQIKNSPQFDASFSLYISEDPYKHLNNVSGLNKLNIALGTKLSKEYTFALIDLEGSIGLTELAPDFSFGFNVNF